jgi:hypothetical protein
MTQAELVQKTTRLGELLKDTRLNMLITVNEASLSTGLHRNTINRLEHGRGCLDSFFLYWNFLEAELLKRNYKIGCEIAECCKVLIRLSELLKNNR